MLHCRQRIDAGSAVPAKSDDSGEWAEILYSLISALDLSATLLSLHFDGEVEVTTLAALGAQCDDALKGALTNRASAMAEEGIRRADQAIDRACITPREGEDGQLIGIVFHSPATRSRIFLTAAFARAGTPDRRLLAAALKRLLPMLDAYLLLWQQHRQETHRSVGLRSALNAVDLGIVLLDRYGAPCFANAAGTALLDDGRLVKRRGSSIHASNLRDTMRLQSAVGAAIAGNAQESGTTPAGTADSAQLRLERDGEQLIVAALPAAVPADEPGAVAAMLVMLKPDGDPEKVAAPVCAIFGLSGVETRLACQLVTGRSLAEACGTLRIRETTGRGYLKQIFAKTNVNRQAELVRVLLSGIVRARSGGLIQVI